MGLNKILNDIIRKQIACGFVIIQQLNPDYTLEEYLLKIKTTLKENNKEIKKVMKQIIVKDKGEKK